MDNQITTHNNSLTCLKKQPQILEKVIQDRIDKWEEKELSIKAGLTYKAKSLDPEKPNNITIDTEFDKSTTTYQRYQIQKSNLSATTGSVNSEYGRVAFSQIVKAQFREGYDHAILANNTNGVLLSMAPKDEIEGMLMSKILVLQNQSMHFLGLAATNENSIALQERYINCATKLSRLENETMEALNRYRRKGEQKVIVQHLNINADKAMVANEIKTGVGIAPKTKGEPHDN